MVNLGNDSWDSGQINVLELNIFNMKLDPKWIVIAGLLLYVLFLQECGVSNNGSVIESEVTTVQTDTIYKTRIDTVKFVETVERVVEVEIDQKLNYTPKFPQYILKIDTIMVSTIATTVQTLKPPFTLDVGAEVGGNPEMFNISPKVGFTSRNGFSYSYRYGILDKTHNIGIMYKLKFSKK